MLTATTTITPAPVATECVSSRTESSAFATVSYEKLIEGDANELAVLLKACERDGFWYLDLRGDIGRLNTIEKDVDTAYKIAGDFFALPCDQKSEFDVDQIGAWKLNGYTPFGRNAGLRGDDAKFGVEGYSIPRDNLCNLIPGEDRCSLPPIYEKNSNFIAGLMSQLHGIGLDILKALDHTAIKESPTWPEQGMRSAHQPSKPSTSCMMIGHYPYLSAESSNAGLAAHTDVGSLTILFCGDRGLQAFRPTAGHWQHLEAKPGCAIVNVGDSLRFLSGKKFRSTLHRVVPYPGTVIKDRFSCAYFLRPQLDAEFADEDDTRWKSIDWHTRKYQGYRQTTKKD